jgi:thymidine kinase
MAAKLTFKYGTMGSSKTAQLLIFAFNLEEKGVNFACFKPVIDTRSGTNIIQSRIEFLRRGAFSFERETNIYAHVFKMIYELDSDNCWKYILIDEAQFLTSEQVDQLAQIVDDFKINVCCYGLRTDFQTLLFPGSKRLFEIADVLEEISTMCECGEKAIFNARFDTIGNLVLDGEQIVIGDDIYCSACRKCYNNFKK